MNEAEKLQHFGHKAQRDEGTWDDYTHIEG